MSVMDRSRVRFQGTQMIQSPRHPSSTSSGVVGCRRLRPADTQRCAGSKRGQRLRQAA